MSHACYTQTRPSVVDTDKGMQKHFEEYQETNNNTPKDIDKRLPEIKIIQNIK